MTDQPTSRCTGAPSAKGVTHISYCPMHGCPHDDASRCDCPTKMGAAHARVTGASGGGGRGPASFPARPERNVSVHVGDDPRPCTCLPGGMTWEPDCPRHAEMFKTEMSRPPVAADPVHTTAWFCDQAKEIIGAGGQRRQDYGDALDSFESIATMWSAILDIKVTAEQVALCQVALKMGRLFQKPNHTDSWVDIIGYAALGGDISHREGRHI